MRVILECMGERQEHRLHAGTSVIGRDPSCDIVFPESSLSRRHLECTVEGEHVVVRDLNTKNGTFLGSQRVEEARLAPGVPLRAGNVWFRFEADPDDAPCAAPEPPLSELLARVPSDEKYEQDEEPTPGVEEIAPAAAGGSDDARVVVRDGRWYLRDPETGTEVEIVPVRQPGVAAPAGALVEAQAPLQPAALPAAQAQLPARIIRRDEVLPAAAAERMAEAGARPGWLANPKRRMAFLLILLGGVVLTLLAVAAYVLTRPKPPPPPMTHAEYNKLADKAVATFMENPTEAIGQVSDLQTKPAEGNPPPKLAHLLQDAFEADLAARRNFAAGWESAEKRWVEVKGDKESTAAARELAKNRLTWLMAVQANNNALEEARNELKQGNVETRESLKQDHYLRTIKSASALASSPLAKDVQPLINQATDAILQMAADQKDHRRWTDAAQTLTDLLKVRPDLAGALKPKIEGYGKGDEQGKEFDAAMTLYEEGKKRNDLQKLGEAQARFEKLGADPSGPYADDVKAPLAEIHRRQEIDRANKAYEAGRGEEAIKIFTDNKMGGAKIVTEIQAVLNAKARAEAALKAGQFGLAKGALEEIGRLASVTNAYAQDAKSKLANLPALQKAAATAMVDQAKAAATEHDYIKVRELLDSVARLDPNNAEAKTLGARLAKTAEADYNIAVNMPRDTVEQLNDILTVLKGVQARLPPDHSLQVSVSLEIDGMERLKAQKMKEAPPKPK